MTAQEAIKELEEIAGTKERGEAISMAIKALEKEKEPQPEQADKNSNSKNPINNDSTKLKRCQEIVEMALDRLASYYGNLTENEENIWDAGEAYGILTAAIKSLEEDNQCAT